MDGNASAFLTTALITIAALLPITNPPGNAPIFLSLTRELTDAERDQMAARVAFNCLAMLVVGMFGGTYILGFFDISLPVVRVAGGLLVAATAWRLLTAEGGSEGDAPRMVRLLGETGTAVFLRLSAFILLCIGVQICWEGLNELLAPWKPVPR